jgi:hypothetical protein
MDGCYQMINKSFRHALTKAFKKTINRIAFGLANR